MPIPGISFRKLCLLSFGLLVFGMSTALSQAAIVINYAQVYLSSDASAWANGVYNTQTDPNSGWVHGINFVYSGSTSAGASAEYPGFASALGTGGGSISVDSLVTPLLSYFNVDGQVSASAFGTTANGTGTTGWGVGGGSGAIRYSLGFTVNSPYHYDLMASVGSAVLGVNQALGSFGLQSSNDLNEWYLEDRGNDNGSLNVSGVLDPGITYWLDAGASCNVRVEGGDVSCDDSFSFSLQLTAVPVPAAVWLFGSGLLGLIGMARRKAA